MIKPDKPDKPNKPDKPEKPNKPDRPDWEVKMDKNQYEGILRRISFYESEQGAASRRVMLNPALNLFHWLFHGLFQGLSLFQHLNFSHWAKPLMLIFALIGGLCFGQ